MTAERLCRLREKLAEKELDAIFITTPENRRYLSGFTGSAGHLLVSARRAVLATDFRYWEQAQQQSPDFELVKVIGGLETWLPQALGDTGARRVGYEAANMSVALYNLVVETLKKMETPQRPEFTPTQDVVEGLRVVKDDAERAAIERAVRCADDAFTAVAAQLRPGMTEQEVAWKLEQHMREHGAESVSFDIIVAAGPNGAMPHHHPSERRIEKGEPVVIDMGARADGYCSDMTRTVILGRADKQFRKVYDIVLGAQMTAAETVQAGMTGHDGDALARSVIEKAGFGEAFGHGLGHGVGLAVHENPRVGRNAKDVLGDGMVFTIEPGIYIPGWGGVRIEDIVSMEKGRARGMTHAPKGAAAEL